METNITDALRFKRTFTTDEIISIVDRLEKKGVSFWYGNNYEGVKDENGINEYLWLPTLCEVFTYNILKDQLNNRKGWMEFPQDLKVKFMNGTRHDLEITNGEHTRYVEVKSNPLRKLSLIKREKWGLHYVFERYLGLQSSSINHGDEEQMTDIAAKVIWAYDKKAKTITFFGGYFLIIGSSYTKSVESEINMQEATLGFTKSNKHYLKDVRLFRCIEIVSLLQNIKKEYNRYYE